MLNADENPMDARRGGVVPVAWGNHRAPLAGAPHGPVSSGGIARLEQIKLSDQLARRLMPELSCTGEAEDFPPLRLQTRQAQLALDFVQPATGLNILPELQRADDPLSVQLHDP
jgi:hypothetical protein